MKVGERPFGVTIDAEGKRAYTANVASNDVSVIDIESRTVVGTVKVGKRPYAVALAKGRAFVTDQYEDTVSVFDVGSLDAGGAHPGRRISRRHRRQPRRLARLCRELGDQHAERHRHRRR